MADYLLARNVTPVAILDNNVSKQGLAYRDIPITPPDLLLGYSAQDSIIFIAARFFAEMSAQCRRLGYDGEIIQVVEYNSFVEYSLTAETILRKTERMRRGVKTLEQIRKQYPKQHLIVCPNNALGDVYWAMSFLPAYLEKNHICDIAVIVIGKACRQVAEMFGVTDIVTLEHNEMDEFVQAIIYTSHGNNIIAQHDRPYTDNIIKWLDKHFLSFIDYYRYAVYGLAKDTQARPPHSFAVFDNRVDMPKGKSVILSPYAKSVVELPSEYWENLVDDYSMKGYTIFTNVAGDEQPIRGTVPIIIPISQMLSAAEYAGTFIGIRNGLCDVLHTADCRKIVVYPDCYYSTTPYKVSEFFDLPGWEKIM
jgi:hypothetical protein